ncbi:MAG: hypothetical protein MHPSP_000454 [Paramarteilia canceri]
MKHLTSTDAVEKITQSLRNSRLSLSKKVKKLIRLKGILYSALKLVAWSSTALKIPLDSEVFDIIKRYMFHKRRFWEKSRHGLNVISLSTHKLKFENDMQDVDYFYRFVGYLLYAAEPFHDISYDDHLEEINYSLKILDHICIKQLFKLFDRNGSKNYIKKSASKTFEPKTLEKSQYLGYQKFIVKFFFKIIAYYINFSLSHKLVKSSNDIDGLTGIINFSGTKDKFYHLSTTDLSPFQGQCFFESFSSSNHSIIMIHLCFFNLILNFKDSFEMICPIIELYQSMFYHKKISIKLVHGLNESSAESTVFYEDLLCSYLNHCLVFFDFEPSSEIVSYQLNFSLKIVDFIGNLRKISDFSCNRKLSFYMLKIIEKYLSFNDGMISNEIYLNTYQEAMKLWIFTNIYQLESQQSWDYFYETVGGIKAQKLFFIVWRKAMDESSKTLNGKDKKTKSQRNKKAKSILYKNDRDFLNTDRILEETIGKNESTLSEIGTTRVPYYRELIVFIIECFSIKKTDEIAQTSLSLLCTILIEQYGICQSISNKERAAIYSTITSALEMNDAQLTKLIFKMFYSNIFLQQHPDLNLIHHRMLQSLSDKNIQKKIPTNQLSIFLHNSSVAVEKLNLQSSMINDTIKVFSSNITDVHISNPNSLVAHFTCLTIRMIRGGQDTECLLKFLDKIRIFKSLNSTLFIESLRSIFQVCIETNNLQPIVHFVFPSVDSFLLDFEFSEFTNGLSPCIITEMILLIAEITMSLYKNEGTDQIKHLLIAPTINTFINKYGSIHGYYSDNGNKEIIAHESSSGFVTMKFTPFINEKSEDFQLEKEKNQEKLEYFKKTTQMIQIKTPENIIYSSQLSKKLVDAGEALESMPFIDDEIKKSICDYEKEINDDESSDEEVDFENYDKFSHEFERNLDVVENKRRQSIKFAIIYVGFGQESWEEIMNNQSASKRYNNFIRSLGLTKIENGKNMIIHYSENLIMNIHVSSVLSSYDLHKKVVDR